MGEYRTSSQSCSSRSRGVGVVSEEKKLNKIQNYSANYCNDRIGGASGGRTSFCSDGNKNKINPSHNNLYKRRRSSDHQPQLKLVRRLWRLAIWTFVYVVLLVTSQNFVSAAEGVEEKATTTLDLELGSERGGFFLKQQEVNDNDLGSSVLNCTPPGISNFPPDLFTKEERQDGAVVVHFLVSLYIFYALLLICDDYFVPSVESICRELKIPSDVAGATFMAASTSAPELFTNFIGTFLTQGDMGVGTIVGSAVFNVLAVASICGIGSAWAVDQVKSSKDGRVGLRLEWFPLTRDTIFYLLSVAALILVLFDVQVDWYEAVGLLLLYGLYILVLRYNGPIKRYTERIVYKIQISCCHGSGKKSRRRVSVSAVTAVGVGGSHVRSKSCENIRSKPNENTPLLFADNEQGIRRAAKIDGETMEEGRSSSEITLSSDVSLSSDDFDEVMVSMALTRSISHRREVKTDWGVFALPRGESWKTWIEYVVAWPIRFVFSVSIPDCREDSWTKWYPVTLIMCVVWIGSLSYVISWMMTAIGDTLNVPDSVTGLTFLAAGTSIPEIVSSVIVARQGLGAMALSNSIGSNTFDILVCLGFPWLVKLLVISTKEVNYIQIASEGMEFSAILMVLTVILLYAVLAMNRFLLDKKVGVIALIMYIVFIVFAILLEMNVFFVVHPPTCSQ